MLREKPRIKKLHRWMAPALRALIDSVSLVAIHSCNWDLKTSHVAVHERMIHDKRETQRGRFGLDGRIKLITAGSHQRLILPTGRSAVVAVV
jgi:hypothetical protein